MCVCACRPREHPIEDEWVKYREKYKVQVWETPKYKVQASLKSILSAHPDNNKFA